MWILVKQGASSSRADHMEKVGPLGMMEIVRWGTRGTATMQLWGQSIITPTDIIAG